LVTQLAVAVDDGRVVGVMLLVEALVALQIGLDHLVRQRGDLLFGALRLGLRERRNEQPEGKTISMRLRFCWPSKRSLHRFSGQVAASTRMGLHIGRPRRARSDRRDGGM
jgi:hypothetical protein